MNSKSMRLDLWANPVQFRNPTKFTKECFTIPPAITFPLYSTPVLGYIYLTIPMTNVAKFQEKHAYKYKEGSLSLVSKHQLGS